MKTLPGKPFPLGASWSSKGVNFALYSANATGVELCLFNADDSVADSIKIKERTHSVWHVFVPGLKPGQRYAYRVDGPYEPSAGHRFNKNKLLLDPYAKAIAGVIEWNDALFGYELGSESSDLSFSNSDSAAYLPKCVVVDPRFDWGDDAPPDTAFHHTIIYELHVKGFTKLNDALPENLRGTYAALGHESSISYLTSLGVTAVELMPVHHFVIDRHLKERGLSNYWGYNTIGFFAPDARYSASGNAGEQVIEFKQMVKNLHAAGIEVILDVVYNHTAEGSEKGPTLSFRGADNASYYRLAEDKRFYFDYTGTGNTLNANLPPVLRLMMDSLRYWVTEMHVDGFRFDLAATLARELHEVNQLSAFFDIIQQDPVISTVKLIAEPWDLGEGGYQVGKFPPEWAEWNGKFRDCIRDYWRGAESMLGEFASRITGSGDLYNSGFRSPSASINFLTAHDGFTLHDLVSYNDRHNEANGEDNKDGESNNRSWNCGAEGVTDDGGINALRSQQKRNMLATLFLSQGVPMLLAGDEFGRTQRGNNNAYCQDNEISWIDWQDGDDSLRKFTSTLIALRKKHPALARKGWFQGRAIHGSGAADIAWFLPDASEMGDEHWSSSFAKSLAVYLNGSQLHFVNEKGQREADDNFYLIFNAHHEPVDYKIPTAGYGAHWKKVVDTSTTDAPEKREITAEDIISVPGRCVIVLQGKQVTKK